MIISRLPSGGGGTKNQELNIFCQLDEPKTKEGIWIKTNKKYKSIVSKAELFEGDGTASSLYTNLPFKFINCAAVMYHGELHIFDVNPNSGTRNHYKLVGASWTKIDQIPMTCYYGSAIVFDNKIYVVVQANDNTMYMYSWDEVDKWKQVCNFAGFTGKYGLVTIVNNIMYLKRIADYSVYGTDPIIWTIDMNTFEFSNASQGPGAGIRAEFSWAGQNVHNGSIWLFGTPSPVIGRNNATYQYLPDLFFAQYSNDVQLPMLSYSFGIFEFNGNSYLIYPIGSNIDGKWTVFDRMYAITYSIQEGKRRVIELKLTQIKDLLKGAYIGAGRVVVDKNGFFVIGGWDGAVFGTSSSSTSAYTSQNWYKLTGYSQKDIDPLTLIVVREDDKFAKYEAKIDSLGGKIVFDDILMTDEDGNIDWDIVVYRGNGTKWNEIK